MQNYFQQNNISIADLAILYDVTYRQAYYYVTNPSDLGNQAGPLKNRNDVIIAFHALPYEQQQSPVKAIKTRVSLSETRIREILREENLFNPTSTSKAKRSRETPNSLEETRPKKKSKSG